MEINPVDLFRSVLPTMDALLLYIDPGSGSAIISAIIGFFIAVGIAVKTYWYKIKQFFTRSAPVGEDANPESTKTD